MPLATGGRFYERFCAMDMIQMARLNGWIRELLAVSERAKEPPVFLPPLAIDEHAALNAEGVDAKQVRLFGPKPHRGVQRQDETGRWFLDVSR
jgi:hypothetical protein